MAPFPTAHDGSSAPSLDDFDMTLGRLCRLIARRAEPAGSVASSWTLLPTLPELFFLAALSVVPVIWLREPGTHVNGNDTSFPLDPVRWFLGRLSMWRSQENGGEDWTVAAAGTFFHGIQAAFAAVGLPYRFAQLGSLIFWQAMLLGSAYVLARTVLQSRHAWPSRMFLVVAYCFNPYMMSGAVWQNVSAANLAGAVALPLLLSLLIEVDVQSHRIGPRTILEASYIGVVAAALAMGPPVLVATIFFPVGIYVVFAAVRAGATRLHRREVISWNGNSLPRLLVAVVILLVCGIITNLYWLLPSMFFWIEQARAFSTSGLKSIGLEDWLAGVSTNTNLINIFRGFGAWDWHAEYNGYPYAPFASTYFTKPVHVLWSFVLPMLLVCGVLLRVRGWVYWSVLALLSAGLAAGAHPPTGAAFLWAVQHVPFFAMFRSPWYKFGMPYALATAVLAALAAHDLSERLAFDSQRDRHMLRRFARLGPAVLALAQLWYSAPQLTGAMFVADRKSVPGFIVRVPAYVFEVAHVLGHSAEDGRILSLPRATSDVYAWGPYSYGSILPLLNLIIATPVIHLPFNNSTARPFDVLVHDIYEMLYYGTGSEDQMVTPCALGRLSVRYILLRGDSSNSVSSGPDSVEALRQLLLTHPYLWLLAQVGKWEVYQLDELAYIPRVSVATSLRPGSSAKELLAYLLNYSALVESVDGRCPDTVLASPSSELTVNRNYRGASVTFSGTNSARYIVHIVPHERGPVGPLILRENFSPLWKAYVLSGRIRKPNLLDLLFASPLPEKSHFLADSYANGWWLPELPPDGATVVLEYQPQRFYIMGWLATVLGLAAILVGTMMLMLRR